MPLVIKMATPRQRSMCDLQLPKEEPVTAVQLALRAQFQTEPPSLAKMWRNALCTAVIHQFLCCGVAIYKPSGI
jgi:hypothetical protein